MRKKNSILRALSVLSLDDILKLSSVDEEILAFEQVAGGEWLSAPEPRRPRTEAKVLTFASPEHVKVKDLEPLKEGEEAELGGLKELSLDFILTQRKLWKEGVSQFGLTSAIEKYLSQVQIISIKEKGHQGKERIRFIATQGLLVDKKQF